MEDFQGGREQGMGGVGMRESYVSKALFLGVQTPENGGESTQMEQSSILRR